MQTISIPFSCSDDDRVYLDELRRLQSVAIRTAYANALAPDGTPRKEADLRYQVKTRVIGDGVLDSWAVQCATRLGITKRKLRSDGKLIFGSRAGLERRRRGLISREQWRRKRLHPFVSYGDRQKTRGNQNVHLIDETTIMVKIGRKESGGRSGKTATRTALLHLPRMTGNRGAIMRQLVEICARSAKKDRINVSYAIGDTHISITFDPQDLPDHPQRRRPVRPRAKRSLGIDLNPNCIGMAVAENLDDPSRVSATSLLEHALVKFDLPIEASPELVRETLAAVADRAIGLARKHRCGTIVLEKGLGKLRSSGKNRSLNRLLNYWARTIFVQMLTRRARLAGIQVVEVWGGYSSTIGNLAFEAPDACAAACEIARRGIARLAKAKDVLPVYEEGCVSRLWKNGRVPAELKSWQDVHRSIKAAKIGYRPPASRPAGRLAGYRCPGVNVRWARGRPPSQTS